MDTDSGSFTPQLGRTVGGRYRLLRVLGAGGMSIVFAAEHVVTRRQVALKLLQFGRDRAFRFLREARAASAIGHPGIVDVLDAGEDDDGTAFIVLERLEGEELGNALAGGKVTSEEAVAHLVEVLDALGAAHDRGIVHRDVKPENIFIARDAEGRLTAKLLDFGVAKLLDARDPRKTTDGLVVGTPAYMSPEQARGQPVDARSDVWSVGAVLFEIFAGISPFDRGTAADSMSAALNAPTPPLPGAPPWLQETVERALEKDPARRFQTARAMRQALLDGLARARSIPSAARRQVSPNASTVIAVEKEAAPSRRVRPAAIYAGIAILLGIAAVLAVRVGTSGDRGGAQPVQSHPAPQGAPADPPRLRLNSPDAPPEEPTVARPAEPTAAEPAEPLRAEAESSPGAGAETSEASDGRRLRDRRRMQRARPAPVAPTLSLPTPPEPMLEYE